MEFLPKVFVTGTTAYNAANLSVSSIPGLGQQSGTANINPFRFSSSVLVGAIVPIYDGGTRAALLDRARKFYLVNEIAVYDDLQNLICLLQHIFT